MMISAFTALALAAPLPAVVGSFGGYDRRIDPGARWERFDLILTNETEEAQTVSVCPTDADLALMTKQKPS